jgi:undecaprenyl-diphosphatase
MLLNVISPSLAIVVLTQIVLWSTLRVGESISLIATWGLLIPVASVACSFLARLRRSWREDLTEGVLAGIATILTVKVASALYFHHRPFVVFHAGPLVAHAADNSFPSDHLAACGLAFGYLWTRNRLLAVVVAISAIIIGFARVIALLHWPLDVISGFLIGLATIVLIQIIIRIAQREPE